MTMQEKIIWRLKEQPTSESLRELVKDGILNKEEARQILFSLEKQEDRDIKSLESEIKFLRELVEKMAKSRSEVITTIREVERPYRRFDWINPYIVWCDTDSLTTASTNGIMYYSASGFSDIKTF